MAFKLTSTGSLAVENPIAMFNDLRTRTVKGLLGNQNEILNDYIARAINKPDVAIKVPTGGGKTLIALCIAEWRRRHFGERAVYLCPTKQLVNQVCAQAQRQYGIAVQPFIGSKRSFDPKAKSDYNSANVIAVTTYAALFNTNPFFSDPNVIVLDDAHAAEGYIASHWSVRLEKNGETLAAFNAITSLIKDSIPEVDFLRLQAPSGDLENRQWTDKLPTTALFQLQTVITSCLDEHLKGTKQHYPWTVIRDHLPACHLYYCGHEMLLRPYLAPAGMHKPYAEATQRIYLSATLGLDGDLERVTGRRSILRLKEAQGSERQGLGRRLFFFPGSSLDEQASLNLATDFIKLAGRAVILTPDSSGATKFAELVQSKLGIPVFNIEQIEQSKDAFVNSPNAVAVLANRYDGIDFPDDECRLLFVSGRPTSTSLHERFIVTRFGAIKALNDRIVTRIVQAFGRCTRSATDYAAVVVLGGDLVGHLERRESRLVFHPELQAELAFGLDQSRDSTESEMLENLRLFLKRDVILDGVEREILSKRDAAQVATPSGASDLKACADLEVDFSEAMWQANYLGALEKARAILGHLNEPSLRGYRALWHYLAGSAAWLAYKTDLLSGDESAAAEQFRNAAKAAPGIRWLNKLAVMGAKPVAMDSLPDSKAMGLIEALEKRIEDLELIHDRKFDAAEAKIRKALLSNEAADFEAGLLQLGDHLGYQAARPSGDSAPDSWWKADTQLGFVFEANSNGDAAVPLDAKKARQAKLHPMWIGQHVSMGKDAQIVSILITPKASVNKDAKVFLKGVAYWDLADFRMWAEAALRAVRSARIGFSAGDLAWRAQAADVLNKANVTPMELQKMLAGMTNTN
jgi:hypothetical protein